MDEGTLQTIANITAVQLKLGYTPKLEFKEVRGGGRARYKTRKITIPINIFNFHPSFQVYYIVHEVCHFKHQGEGHSKDFKKLEKRMLRFFDIGIEYARAYPKRLYLYDTGVTVYEKKELKEKWNKGG